MLVGARPMIELLASGSSGIVSVDMPEPSARSKKRLGPPSSLAPTRAEKVSEGRQARPERFETRIYALVPAIDLVLGGRGRLAGRIGANPCPVCRERP